MANSRAKARIEARIRERVAYCIEFELNDPRASFVTVTGVEVSPDLSIAKIQYSVYGTDGDRSKVAHMLEDATGFVRKQVGRVLRTRRIPKLRWFYDDSIELQANMEDAIASALDRDRAINPEAHGGDPEAPQEEPEADEHRAVDDEYHDFLDAQEKEDL
jgi:ribosome-binding factor A